MNSCNCLSENAVCDCFPSPSAALPLAIATVPMQPWETPFDSATALKQGTIFPSLNLMFFAAGGEYHV